MKTGGAEFGTERGYIIPPVVDSIFMNLLAKRLWGFENFLQSWKRSVKTVYIMGSS